MASEILAVPEDSLGQVIAIIRAGLAETQGLESIDDDTREHLVEWCDDEETYLASLLDDTTTEP